MTDHNPDPTSSIRGARSARRSRRSHRSRRRGLATLEMALSFPILFFMAALIFVMAKGMVLTSETSIEARKNSFEQALDKRTSGGMTRFVLTDTKFNADIHSGTAHRTAEVIPVLGSKTIQGNAQVAVLRNTWDYRELPLNETNRLSLYGGVLAGGSGGTLTSLIGKLTDLAGDLGSLVDPLGALSQATQGSPASRFTPFDELKSAKDAAAAGLKDLQGKVDELQGEVDDLKDEIKDLKGDDLTKAKEKLQKLETNLDKEKGRLDFLKGKNP